MLILDLFFGYVVFSWFIYYFYGWISYSPKFALIIGLFESIIMFNILLSQNTNNQKILHFIFLTVISKAIPLYLLRNQTIQKRDIKMTFFVFFIYLICLHLIKLYINLSLLKKI
jgi:hypothetical protein